MKKQKVNKGYHDYFKNKDLVNNYFEIGRLLVEAQGKEEKAKYGNGLIKEWSKELTEKYGKGYNSSNLKRFRQFYLIFKKSQPLAVLLTCTYIKILLPIKDTLKDPMLITINEDLDNVSEEKLVKIIRKELEIFLLELGCN